MLIFFCFILGYCACTFGYLTGGLLSVFTKRLGKKLESLLMAFSAGLLLAFVCFEMLPQAFAGNLILGLAALTAGALAAIGVESSGGKSFGAVLVFGLALHKLPEGLALGALFNVNFRAGLSLALVIALHCILESLALTMVLKQAGMRYGKILFSLMLVGIPMAFGAGVGAVIGHISPWFLTASLSFAGGIMVYLSCGEILPEVTETGSALLTILGAAAGFMAGAWIIGLL